MNLKKLLRVLDKRSPVNSFDDFNNILSRLIKLRSDLYEFAQSNPKLWESLDIDITVLSSAYNYIQEFTHHPSELKRNSRTKH